MYSPRSVSTVSKPAASRWGLRPISSPIIDFALAMTRTPASRHSPAMVSPGLGPVAGPVNLDAGRGRRGFPTASRYESRCASVRSLMSRARSRSASNSGRRVDGVAAVAGEVDLQAIEGLAQLRVRQRVAAFLLESRGFRPSSLAGSRDRRLVAAVGQHFGDVADGERPAFARQPAGDVEQAPHVAAEQQSGGRWRRRRRPCCRPSAARCRGISRRTRRRTRNIHGCRPSRREDRPSTVRKSRRGCASIPSSRKPEHES